MVKKVMFRQICFSVVVCFCISACAATAQKKVQGFESYIYAPEYREYVENTARQNIPQSMRTCKSIVVDEARDKSFWIEQQPVFPESPAYGAHHPIKGRWGQRVFASGCGETHGIQVIHQAVPGQRPDLFLKYYKGIKKEEFLTQR